MRPRGAALIDSLAVIFLFAALAALFHLEVVGRWKEKLQALDRERLPYDGAWRAER